jgi:6-pyruvoyl-tetrahydropterin synthase
MYELMVETFFSAAHQLRGYDGKCENLHGHNWRVNVHVTAERLNEIGLACDISANAANQRRMQSSVPGNSCDEEISHVPERCFSAEYCSVFVRWLTSHATLSSTLFNLFDHRC